MSYFKCLLCSKSAYVKPSHQLLGSGKYCSKKCASLGQRNGSFVNCFICNEPIYRSLHDRRRSKSKKFFCTKSCQTIWRNSILYTEKNHPNWTGGEYSYRQRLIRSSQLQECAKCNGQDPRVLAVHHKDKNRKNNSLDNLTWLCHNCHYLVHHYDKESIGFITIPKSL